MASIPYCTTLTCVHRQAPSSALPVAPAAAKAPWFRLLLREFNLQQQSTITLGGTALEQIRLHALRAQMAWVPQEPMLFSGTIADNIAFARPNATPEQIEQAAKLAAIHGEIIAFKQGYQTVLGEQGINLSGGQKQRIAFARAPLTDAPILLLDDAFSALEQKTEATILKNIRQYHGKKTILLITQRLPELIHADHILVIDDGRIVEQGSHGALLANEQWYARIYRQQARSQQLLELEQPTIVANKAPAGERMKLFSHYQGLKTSHQLQQTLQTRLCSSDAAADYCHRL